MKEWLGYEILLNKHNIDLRNANKKSDEETRAVRIFLDSHGSEDFEALRYCIVDYIFHKYSHDIGKRACGKYYSVEADDVIQITMLKIFKSIHNFRQESTLSSYIFRIAVNVCYEIMRTDPYLKINFLNIDDVTVVYNPKNSYDNIIMLNAAINSLAPGYRDVINRQYFQQQTPEEIALYTGKSQGSVKSQIHKAKNRIREILLINYSVAA